MYQETLVNCELTWVGILTNKDILNTNYSINLSFLCKTKIERVGH